MKTLFFLVWPILAYLTTGCTTMSRTQCTKGTRVILVSNLLLDGLKRDSIAMVSWNRNNRQLRRDESFEIVQFADDNHMVPAIELAIHWNGQIKKVSFPALQVDMHFFGPREPVDLFLGPNLDMIVLGAY